jgi:hypothetical protein
MSTDQQHSDRNILAEGVESRPHLSPPLVKPPHDGTQPFLKENSVNIKPVRFTTGEALKDSDCYAVMLAHELGEKPMRVVQHQTCAKCGGVFWLELTMFRLPKLARFGWLKECSCKTKQEWQECHRRMKEWVGNVLDYEYERVGEPDRDKIVFIMPLSRNSAVLLPKEMEGVMLA